MRVAIMQPYFFPYIGYIELVHNVDLFVFYDDAAFSKNGWCNRNRIVSAQKEFEYIRASIKKAPLGTTICDTLLSDVESDLRRTLAVLEIYKNTPNYERILSIVQETHLACGKSLSQLASSTVKAACKFIGIDRPFAHSSTLDYDRNADALNKVLQICDLVGATQYINLSGGRELYDKESFNKHGISLKFTTESQFSLASDNLPHVKNLSIIDTMMRHDVLDISRYLIAREL